MPKMTLRRTVGPSRSPSRLYQSPHVDNLLMRLEAEQKAFQSSMKFPSRPQVGMFTSRPNALTTQELLSRSAQKNAQEDVWQRRMNRPPVVVSVNPRSRLSPGLRSLYVPSVRQVSSLTSAVQAPLQSQTSVKPSKRLLVEDPSLPGVKLPHAPGSLPLLHKESGELVSGELALAYRLCLQRQERREVLGSLGQLGRAHRNPEFTKLSKVDCTKIVERFKNFLGGV